MNMCSWFYIVYPKTHTYKYTFGEMLLNSRALSYLLFLFLSQTKQNLQVITRIGHCIDFQINDCLVFVKFVIFVNCISALRHTFVGLSDADKSCFSYILRCVQSCDLPCVQNVALTSPLLSADGQLE